MQLPAFRDTISGKSHALAPQCAGRSGSRSYLTVFLFLPFSPKVCAHRVTVSSQLPHVRRAHLVVPFVRPFRFIVHIMPTGTVAVRSAPPGMSPLKALVDLRDKLADQPTPFGYTATIVGVRSEPESPPA